MKNYPIKLTPFEIIIWKYASDAVKEEGFQDVRGGVPRLPPRPGSWSQWRRPWRRPGGSRPGPISRAGRMESPSLLPLSPGKAESRREHSRHNEHNQWSLLPDLPWALPPSLLPHFLCELPQGPESGWQTVMSNLWVSQARSHNLPASVWPQSNCYRKVTSLRDGHSVPPTDSLLRFLVESSSDEFPSCANCDRNEKSPMFFCNTCGKWWSWIGGRQREHHNFSPSLLAAI